MSALMSDQQSNSNVAEFFSPGPGERLRAARLSMGFDLAKIASELHLTTPVVEALEADQYADIGARVFVRGYLRNYARIVDMPVESILRQFDEKWPDDNAHQSMVRESPRLPADAGPSRGMAGAMTWLLVLGLVALFLMWWRGYLDELVPEQIRSANVEDADSAGVTGLPQPTEDTVVVQPDGSLLLPDHGVSADLPPGSASEMPAAETSTPPEVPAVEVDEPPAAEIEVPAPAVSQDTTDAPEPAAAVTADAPVENADVADNAVAATTQDEGVAITRAAPAEPAGAPVVEGSKQVVMTFSAPCWVDVRDSARKFKLFGEMGKGTRKVLGGEPPYNVVIGNSEAVTITVNGRPFDIAPYANGNVARFTLDP
jgi:cytoskeleton protein RodZ